jgi:3-deoxy-manno-octulosonate cytidylyltransferase (CMP-KDO synthetase)
LKSCFNDEQTLIATLAKAFTSTDDLFNPNHVKVIKDIHDRAIYFSRSTIPYIRGEEEQNWIGKFPFFKHIGIYAYKYHVLEAITKLDASALEIAESLEQNRWIENGYTIKVKECYSENASVDTPEDLEKIKQLFFTND